MPNDYIDLGVITNTSTLTISAWINSDDLTSTQCIVSDGQMTNVGYRLEFGRTNETFSWVHAGNVVSTANASAITTTGTWHNIIVIRTGSAGNWTIKYYVDGAPWGSTTGITIDPDSTVDNTALGSRGDGSGLFFNGKMSNVSIWNTELTSTELETLYNYGSPIRTLANIPQNSNLQGWWKLDASEVYNNTTTEWSVDNNQNPSSYTSSLDFNSADSDYIEIPKDSTLSFVNTDFSISIWLNPEVSHNGLVMMNYYGSSGWGLYYQSGSIRFYDSLVWTTVTTINTNEWTHILIVGDYTGSNLLCYKNGVEVYNSSHTFSITDSNTSVFIGSERGAGFFFNGSISNASIWNSALTSTQVTELYNNGTPSNLSSHSATSNLISWWKLNNTTTGIEDAKGSNNGTNNGATEYAGFVNTLAGDSSGMSQANLVQSDLQTVAPYSKYALAFDGTNDYIDCGVSSFNGETGITVSGWVYPTSTGTGSAEAILSTERTSSSLRGFYLSLYINNEFRWQVSTDGNSKDSLDSGAILLNQWSHIAATWNQSTMSLYVNGSLADTMNTVNATGTFTNTNNIFIAKRDSSAGFFPGSISNPSIWNTALTSAQVTEIYNQGLPGNLNSHSAYSNLVSWWQLGENSSFDGNDWILADEKGTNNGTSVSMPVGALVNGVGTTANGVSSGMSEGNLVGDAPYSTANALSTNMIVTSRVSGSGNTP